MLKHLEIKNFQSHKDSSLSFHPGMNVITGTSDSGKSAIIRALIWALKNRPSGESFKTWSAKSDAVVEVSLEFDDDWFTKSRANNKNKYETEDGSYEALRHDVPKPIDEIANMADYNLQTQFQSYFMLQDSPGDRAKQLNILVGLDIVDKVLKKLGQKANLTKQLIKSETEKANNATNELSKFDHIPSVEVLINDITQHLNKHTKLIGELDCLSESASKIIEYDEKIAQLQKVCDLEKECNQIKVKVVRMDELKWRYEALKKTIASLIDVTERLQDDKDWLLVEGYYDKVKTLSDKLTIIQSKQTDISGAITALQRLENQIKAAKESMEEKILKYTNMLIEAGVCPTCKSKVSKTTVNHILTEMNS